MSPSKSTRQQLVKVPQVPCLYRHSLSRKYYGIKKVGGKRKEHSLDTIDRKLAERRLKKWIADLGKTNVEVERLTLREMLVQLQKVNQGKASKTRATDASIIRKFEETWPYDLDMRVSDVRTSHLNEWLALHEQRLKHTTYNRYAGFIKQLFAIAVDDRVIAESPAVKLKTPWKSPQTPKRHVPTIAQFEALVAHIRNQPFANKAEDTADFVEFLGYSGLRLGEATQVLWRDVNFDADTLLVTGGEHGTKNHEVRTLPLFPPLRRLLEGLAKSNGHSQNARLFGIDSAKKSIATACEKSGIPHFGHHAMRHFFCSNAIEAGCDFKVIAGWLGHKDGGVLVAMTYGHLRNEHSTAMAKKLTFEIAPSAVSAAA